MHTILYETLRAAILREEPVVTATVMNGEMAGAKLLIRADGATIGALHGAVPPELQVPERQPRTLSTVSGTEREFAG